MADFIPAFEKMILNEGGYILHDSQGDLGGQTFAGISRNYHYDWEGWRLVDKDDLSNPKLTQMVRDFYRANFWDRLQGSKIKHQKIAEALFDFSVNAGVHTASKLAQLVIEVTPDGIIGLKSLQGLNAANEEIFVIKYALAKIARYAEICRAQPDQKRFLLGWINRSLQAAS